MSYWIIGGSLYLLFMAFTFAFIYGAGKMNKDYDKAVEDYFNNGQA